MTKINVYFRQGKGTLVTLRNIRGVRYFRNLDNGN